MKLSKAILEGSKLRKKTMGSLFYENKSCALGAAYEYAFGKLSKKDLMGDINGEYNSPKYKRLRKKFPELDYEYGHPKHDDRKDRLLDIITQLNDEFKWSRKNIARWLMKMGL